MLVERVVEVYFDFFIFAVVYIPYGADVFVLFLKRSDGKRRQIAVGENPVFVVFDQRVRQVRPTEGRLYDFRRFGAVNLCVIHFFVVIVVGFSRGVFIGKARRSAPHDIIRAVCRFKYADNAENRASQSRYVACDVSVAVACVHNHSSVPDEASERNIPIRRVACQKHARLRIAAFVRQRIRIIAALNSAGIAIANDAARRGKSVVHFSRVSDFSFVVAGENSILSAPRAANHTGGMADDAADRQAARNVAEVEATDDAVVSDCGKRLHTDRFRARSAHDAANRLFVGHDSRVVAALNDVAVSGVARDAAEERVAG